MNAIDMAKTAYESGAAPVRTERGTEYLLFSRVTNRLADAEEGNPTGFQALAQAVHDNRRLWSTLAANVADHDNNLPKPLRARIFYLAEFVEHHSRLVLKGRAPLVPLIDINTAVMRGLSPEGGQE